MNCRAFPGLLAFLLLAVLPCAALAGPSSAAHRDAVEQQNARAAEAASDTSEAEASVSEDGSTLGETESDSSYEDESGDADEYGSEEEAEEGFDEDE